jgi:diguanylate cyclase (GGDEF)-like protein/PAS domain S-box-containing protein
MHESGEVAHDGELLRALIDHVPAMLGFWDRDCRNILANQAYVEWFGRTPGEIRGRHIREILGEDIYARNLPYIEGALQGKRQHFQRTIVDAGGRTRFSQADYIPDLGADGEVRGFFVLVSDVTQRVEAEHELARKTAEMADLASTDALTGLRNRRGLEEAVAARRDHVGRRGDEPRHVAVIMVDLDGFKVINDSFGHLVGDTVLVCAADRLRSAVRSDDVLVRLGGDEFIILMGDREGGAQAQSVGTRISDLLTQPIVLADDPASAVSITCSIGIAVAEVTAGDIPLRALLAAADGQMYRSKFSGPEQPLAPVVVTDIP